MDTPDRIITLPEQIDWTQYNRKQRRWFQSKTGQKIVGALKPIVHSVSEKAAKMLRSKKRIKHAIRLAKNRDELVATD